MTCFHFRKEFLADFMSPFRPVPLAERAVKQSTDGVIYSNVQFGIHGFVFSFLTGHFVWETNLQPVSNVIDIHADASASPGLTLPGEQVILLGGVNVFAVVKSHVDEHQRGVICEF